MIDIDGYESAQPNNVSSLLPHTRRAARLLPATGDVFSSELGTKAHDIDDGCTLLAPSHVPGFALEDKMWARFHVKSLMAVSPPSRADWDILRLPGGRKEELLNLSELQIVEGAEAPPDAKGVGLTVLLFGPTGSGKTYTVGKSASAMSFKYPYFSADTL